MAKPTVFLSAVTGDLGLERLRGLATTIHNDFACVCRHRDNLRHGDALLVAKLREEIEEADFVLHFVGPSYGFEPIAPATGPRPADELWRPACQTWWPGAALPERRSYTQMELDFALALKKSVFVIFIEDPQIVAGAVGQTTDNARLQKEHQAAIRQRGHEYVRLDSVANLDDLVRKVPVVAKHLRAQVVARDEALAKAENAVRQEGGKNRRLLIAAVALVLLLVGGVGWLIREQHRRVGIAVAVDHRLLRVEAVYREMTRPAAPGDGPTEEVRRSQAVARVAREFSLEAGDVWRDLAQFFAVVHGDAGAKTREEAGLARRIRAEPLARARVLFLEGKYTEAEKTALSTGASSPDGFLIAGDVRLRQLRYPAALESYRQAAALVPETDRAAWFDVQLKLLHVLWRLARYAEARELTGRLLGVFGSWDGSDTRLYSTLIGYDALLLQQQGKLDEAVARCREALKIREEVFGEGHPDTAPALNNLAGLLQTSGNLQEAEVLYRRAVEIGEKALGSEQPAAAVGSATLAKSKNNLAALLVTVGKTSEAEALYLSALDLSQNASGPDSPDVAVALSNLGGFYQRQGNLAEAKKRYARSLKILEKSLGRDHSDTATVAHNFAVLLGSGGDLAEAGKQFERALEIREKRLGADHPDTVLTVCLLADLRQREKNGEAAESLYRRALAAREKTLGPDAAAVATVCGNLAGVLQDQRKGEEAEALYRRALEIREKTEAPDSIEIGRSLNNLGAALCDLGRFGEAEPLLQRALAIALGHPVAEASLLARIYYWLALNQRALGSDATARATSRLAVAAAVRAFGPEHPKTREAAQLFPDQAF